MISGRWSVVLAAGAFACATYDPYPYADPRVSVAVTASGPYVTPHMGVGVGVGVGISTRRAPGARPAQGEAEERGPMIVTADTGVKYRVDAARVAVGGAEFSSCDEGDAADAVRKLQRGEAVETKVVDLLALRERQLGMLELRPGAYCTVAVRLAPADGRTLEMQGAFLRPGETEWTSFSLSTAGTVTTGMKLQQPLRLAAGQKDAAVHVRFQPERWFEGVDPSAPAEEVASHVLANLAARPGESLTPRDGQQSAR